MKKAIEHIFSGLTTSISSYDSTRTNLGRTFIQDVASGVPRVGPAAIAIARPMEQSTAIPLMMPSVVSFSNTIDWVFLVDNATAAATRRVVLYTYNKSTGVYSWSGFVTVGFPFAGTQGTYTVRGFYVERYTHSTGTVAVSGTAVTGTGTAWQTNRFAVGSRIGFGSTDPTQITTWYDVSAIASDTGLTLGASAGTIGSGTSYVIEELRVVWALTNGTTVTNGGLFVTKGLNFGSFTVGGSITVAAAVTTDNVRATYKLSDATTTTMTTACGISVASGSLTSQTIYFLNGGGTSNARVFTFNIRAALTLTAGQDVSSFVLQTGNGLVTGTLQQNNSMILATCAHGPASGVASLYFCTGTRINRAAVSNITNGSTSFVNDAMVEIPPGSTTTFPLTNALSTLQYEPNIDRFLIMTTGATAFRHYVSQYRTDSGAMDHIWGSDDKGQMQSSASSELPFYFTTGSQPVSIDTKNGFAHIIIHNAAATYNQLLCIPISCDYNYNPTGSNSNDFLILPKMNVSDLKKAYRAYLTRDRLVGGDNLGLPTEGFKLYYRTGGIDDNSGTWIATPEGNDLSGIAPTSNIQFAVAFKIFGGTCIPSKLYSLAFIYEDNSTDSRYNASITNSNAESKIFAYRQISAWGSNIPNMEILIYNAETGALVLSDTTASQISGTFEYSSNGGSSWSAWSASADSVGNLVRYAATSLPDGIAVRAIFRQA